MRKLTKMLVIAFVAILVIGFAGSCKKKIVGNDPYTIDLSLLPQVAWPSDICANEDKLEIGEERCEICPTCEGKTTVVMNADPLERQWADFAIFLPEFPEDINWAGFNRARVRVRYYYDDFIEFDPANSKVMVSLIYDPDGDWRGPSEGPGPNTPLKAFNLTNGRRPWEADFEEDALPFGSRDGASGISSNRGAFTFLTQAPSVILFQNADANVAYIEVTEITFFFLPLVSDD